MKKNKILRGGAACAAAFLMCTFAAMSSFAEEESDTENPEALLHTSGDFTYSILTNADNEDEHAACIERYEGNDEEVKIPSELDGLSVIQLGERAFVNADSLKKVTIPKTIEQIGTYTFASCDQLEEYAVETSSAVFTARDGVLYADESTTLVRWPLGRDDAKIEIPEGVTMVDNSAFADSQKITDVKFPESLRYIGASAFASCTGLTALTLPDSVIQIGDFAFNSCSNLKTVKLSENLDSIGAGAFAATALETVDLPNKLSTVGEQAFIATPMESVTIPPSVGEIGYSAFGWHVEQSGELYAKSGFVIRGYADTGAYYYAYDEDNLNKFVFETIEAETNDSAAAEDSAEESAAETSEESSEAEQADSEAESDSVHPGKVIGISACGAAILGILAAAAVSGKKKSNKEKKDDA